MPDMSQITVTPSIALSFVGILPLANSGALLQSTPVDGVLVGARFVPLIGSHVLLASRCLSRR